MGETQKRGGVFRFSASGPQNTENGGLQKHGLNEAQTRLKRGPLARFGPQGAFLTLRGGSNEAP